MLKNFLQYTNFDLIPKEKKYNLIQLNIELINKINQLRMKLNHDQYNIAYNEYKKIINPSTISFLRRLMYEQQIQFMTEDDLLIDFSNVDEDINLEQNILLNRLINHKKMRNIVKYLVLKKYVKIFGEQQDYEDLSYLKKKLYEKLIKIDFEKENKIFLLSILQNNKIGGYLRGGSEEDGSSTFDNLLFVSIALYFNNNKKVVDLCKNIIIKQNSDGSGNDIVSRLSKVLSSNSDFMALLGPAILSNEVDDYNSIFKQLIKDDMKEIVKIVNLKVILLQKDILIKNKKNFLPEVILYIVIMNAPQSFNESIKSMILEKKVFEHFGYQFENFIKNLYPKLSEKEKENILKQQQENKEKLEREAAELAELQQKIAENVAKAVAEAEAKAASAAKAAAEAAAAKVAAAEAEAKAAAEAAAKAATEAKTDTTAEAKAAAEAAAKAAAEAESELEALAAESAAVKAQQAELEKRDKENLEIIRLNTEIIGYIDLIREKLKERHTPQYINEMIEYINKVIIPGKNIDEKKEYLANIKNIVNPQNEQTKSTWKDIAKEYIPYLTLGSLWFYALLNFKPNPTEGFMPQETYAQAATNMTGAIQVNNSTALDTSVVGVGLATAGLAKLSSMFTNPSPPPQSSWTYPSNLQQQQAAFHTVELTPKNFQVVNKVKKNIFSSHTSVAESSPTSVVESPPASVASETTSHVSTPPVNPWASDIETLQKTNNELISLNINTVNAGEVSTLVQKISEITTDISNSLQEISSKIKDKATNAIENIGEFKDKTFNELSTLSDTFLKKIEEFKKKIEEFKKNTYSFSEDILKQLKDACVKLIDSLSKFKDLVSAQVSDWIGKLFLSVLNLYYLIAQKLYDNSELSSKGNFEIIQNNFKEIITNFRNFIVRKSGDMDYSTEPIEEAFRNIQHGIEKYSYIREYFDITKLQEIFNFLKTNSTSLNKKYLHKYLKYKQKYLQLK